MKSYPQHKLLDIHLKVGRGVRKPKNVFFAIIYYNSK